MRTMMVRLGAVLGCLMPVLVGGLVLAGSVSASVRVRRVYVDCQNAAETRFNLARHPRRCILVGEPQMSATTVQLVNMTWKHWGSASATGTGISVDTGMGTTIRSKVRVRVYRIVQGCGARGSRPYYYTSARVTIDGSTGTLQLPFNSC